MTTASDQLPVPAPALRAPRIVGLDLSLTSTGVAVIGDGFAVTDSIRTAPVTGHARLQRIRAEIRATLPGDTVVAVEGPSFNSAGSAVHQLGGLWWLVTHMLWRQQVPYVVITPAQVKRYATGKGNAPKDAVLAAVIRRYPRVEVGGNDEADALVLAAMLADWYGCPLAPVPAVNRAALASVTGWPDLPQPAGYRIPPPDVPRG